MSDDFLQSMTFARGDDFLGKCDCEECENIPPSIRVAIDLQKRKRRATGQIKRTQQRSLLKRDGQVSLWCVNMPMNAEPLVEFGSNHRIVWVCHLKDRSTLKWIGNGIIGSSDEEKSRKTMMEWTKGNFFLVPSNGGKAIGWIHTGNGDSVLANTKTANSDANDASLTNEGKSESHGIAVLCVAKIPPYLVDQDRGTSGGNNKNWTNRLIEWCRKGLENYKNQSGKQTLSYYKFSDEASKLLKLAFREAEGVEAKNDDTIEPASKRIRLDPQVI